MRRRALLSLVLALCMMGALLLVGCGGNTNVGTSVLPGPQMEAESSSSNQSAGQDTTHGTPDETNDELADLPAGNTSDHNYVNTWYDFPDWDRDFTADRFIPLDRFVWHLEESGSSFSLMSANPIEFSNGGVVIYVLPDGVMGVTEVRVRNMDGSGGSQTGGTPAPSFQIKDGSLGWLLAEELWVAMDIGEMSTNTPTFWTAWAAASEEGFFLERHRQHNVMLHSHRHLTSEMNVMDMPPLEWHNSRWEPTVAIDAFNMEIANKNANFRQIGESAWSNEFLTIEVIHTGDGWGIIIHDGAGMQVEAFDNSGWYSMSDGKMTYGLANALWYTVAFCDAFISMAPVLAEEAMNDSFRLWAASGVMFPQQ